MLIQSWLDFSGQGSFFWRVLVFLVIAGAVVWVQNRRAKNKRAMGGRGRTWTLGPQADPPVESKEAQAERVRNYCAQREQRRNQQMAEARKDLDSRTKSYMSAMLWRLRQAHLDPGKKREERGLEKFEACRVAWSEGERSKGALAQEWKATQATLSRVLDLQFEGEVDAEKLQSSAAAYREALDGGLQGRAPEFWALLQNCLGNVLINIGEVEPGTEHLEEAVKAFRSALTELNCEREREAWAVTQKNLAVALLRIGERQPGTARLEEAVAALTSALEVLRQSNPESLLADIEGGLERAREALEDRRKHTN